MDTLQTSNTSGTPQARPQARDRASDRYKAVWRWHFYAGLLVLPFLAWLAVTGGLYVFKNQIDGFFHDRLLHVAQPQTPRAAHSHQEIAAAALAAQPGKLLKYLPAPGPTRTAEALIATVDGQRLSVFVDPYRAEVVGTLPEGGSVAWTIRRLHSLKYFGSVARGAIEIAAGWSILLVATGVYLWWPRGRSGGVVSVRGTPSKRVFWRDLHAVTGWVVGGVLLFLALTGMPWSVLWGAKANQWANGHNYGYPAGLRVQVPMSGLRLSEDGHTAWSLQQAQLPQSGHEGHEGHEEHAGHDAMPAQTPSSLSSASPSQPASLSLDQAVAAVERLGIAAGYAIQLPTGPQGVYTASVYPEDLSHQRVIHLDQYSGKALLDMSYADYGPLGKTLEWGINVHLGQEYGVVNQIVLVVACLGIALLCVTAAVMWWKRRPARHLGVPPMPANRRVLQGVSAILLLGAILFPLVAVSLLVMALLDRLAFPPHSTAAH
ncbi:PepSY-associated TM helix domain-containing protein [Delftia tsuruhatensis]|uniref:PepSY-associated TM helix domain-containing protein n=1 Tax=Delftia tsuruhatensis TaxID=180282 RepID=UPI002AD48EF1|nr:PepSY domain-containing protein [Delftia tsuruhatensis]WQM85948.1 PepSY domain-containing protein [Delftia tsuruhatensis]